MKINIAAINLQSGVATTKGRFHYALTGWKYWLPHSDKPIHNAGEMIKQEDVDIACITEITEKSLRSGFKSQTEILASSADLKNWNFFSSQKLGKFFFHEGNALLSKSPISNPISRPLHIELNMRMALEEATVEIQGQKISVFIAHLALTRRARQIQISEIIEILKDRTGPMILSGDFNERDPEALDILLTKTPLKRKCNLNTFPSWSPKYPLDYIFLSGEFTVLDCYVPKSPAFSDHKTLIVKTELD